MRPLFTTDDDLIKNIGDASWENIPAHLERNLVGIPAKVVQHQTRVYERVTHILNIILSLWVLTSVLIFREYWSPLVSRFTENIASNMSPPYAWMSQPLTILILLGACWFSFMWSDTDSKRTEIHR